MIFTEIGISNFRVYLGDHKLTLHPPEGGRCVYLIGGLNGAGKTSLFSAVALGLYGAEAEGLVFERSRDAYAQFLEESLAHAARVAGESEMRVRLEGTHDESAIVVERTWWFERGKFIDESLTVWLDGRPLHLEGVETEEQRASVLQEFLEELAPSRVGKFFFFDGEEIRRIAEREPSEAVVEGLNQLLGFHALTRANNDLTTLRRALQRETPGASTWVLDDAISELEQAETEARDSARAVKQLETEHAEVVRDLEMVEGELKAFMGGSDVRDRSQALDALARLERELAATATEIQLFVTEVLVLALPGRLLQAASRRAAREGKARRMRDARRQLRSARDQVWGELAESIANGAPKLSAPQKKALAKQFESAWGKIVEGREKPGAEWFTALSTEDLERLPETSKQVLATARRELDARLNRRLHLEREVSRIRQAEALIDGNARVQALLDTKSTLLETQADAERRLQTAQATDDALKHELASKRAAVARVEAQLKVSDNIGAEIAVIGRLQAACAEFVEALRRDRATALADKATEMIARLAHKEDLISRLELDPETFEIRMFERNGEQVDSLSAGEREVFALSLVWALGQISQRELPVMIDTPLGRLDQMHRGNVVREFLPHAGKQVLVLSTDSEIDARWHELLQDRVVQYVTIEYDDVEHQSSLRPDSYFDIVETVS